MGGDSTQLIAGLGVWLITYGLSRKGLMATSSWRVPVLNEQQHDRRVRELRRAGCKVREVRTRGGDLVVLRNCPGGR